MGARDRLPGDVHKGFDSAILLVSWMLWKERNARVFDNTSCAASMLVAKVLEEGDAWLAAGFSALIVGIVAP